MAEFTPDNEKIEFRTIVLTHIRNVLNLSLKTTSEGALKIKAMHDAVMSLSDVLLPFYDDEMDKCYTDYKKNIKDLREKGINEHGKIIGGIYYTGLKNITRELFRALNLLMKRIDYLKSSIYGDNDSSDDVVEDDGEED